MVSRQWSDSSSLQMVSQGSCLGDAVSVRGPPPGMCTGCWSVLEDQIILSEIPFAEGAGGVSSMVRQFVATDGKSRVLQGEVGGVMYRMWVSPRLGGGVCTRCRSVLEDQIIVSEIPFAEGASGVLSMVGQFVATDGKSEVLPGGGWGYVQDVGQSSKTR